MKFKIGDKVRILNKSVGRRFFVPNVIVTINKIYLPHDKGNYTKSVHTYSYNSGSDQFLERDLEFVEKVIREEQMELPFSL